MIASLPPAHQLPELVKNRRTKPRRILLDGPSGSGKTTLANRLEEQGYLVLHLDSWYPGWKGLRQASLITEKLLAGQLDAYPQWDWDAERVARDVPVDRSLPWVIEGCGSLTKENARLADLRVWLHLDETSSRQRGLARDGEGFEPWWDTWRTQEEQHWQDNRPWELADIELDATRGSLGTLN